MKTDKGYRIQLINLDVIGQRCGWGEGLTKQEAIEDALQRARRTDPEAHYSQQCDAVVFQGGCIL